jgi:hypothetical protein
MVDSGRNRTQNGFKRISRDLRPQPNPGRSADHGLTHCCPIRLARRVAGQRGGARVGLPTFIIAGERRCGTSFLASLMERHPDVFVHPKRELGFFLDDSARWASRRRFESVSGGPEGGRHQADDALDQWGAGHPIEAYRAQFDQARRRIAVGEKSADYLFWRPAHPRMAQLLPETRLIVILRDPVRRAWSHYWNEVGKRREPLSFAEALEVEERRAASSLYARNHASYFRRGFYDESLEHLFRHVPAPSVLVVTLEELVAEPQETLGRVLEFIGVGPVPLNSTAGLSRNANWAMVPKPWTRRAGIEGVSRAYGRACEVALAPLLRSRPRRIAAARRIQAPLLHPASEIVMPREVHGELARRYRPHVDRLAQLVGREFPGWTL